MRKDQIEKALSEGKTVYGSGGKKFKPIIKTEAKTDTKEPVKQEYSGSKSSKEGKG